MNLFGSCLFGFAVLGILTCRGSEFRVGVAAVDITPPLAVPLAGYYHERGADGVVDRLHSKALVIESAGKRVAIVTLDIIGVSQDLTALARGAIEKSTEIKGTDVMISATHAHTGPQLTNRGKRVSGTGGQAEIAAAYTEGLPNLIAESVRQANANVRSVRLNAAKGECDDLAFNRRYYLRDGSVGWNPGKLNPNIASPAGPSTSEVGVLYAVSEGAGDPRMGVATYVNFAMHPDTCGGSKISADWPGALSRILAGYHGTNHITLVGNGTCGNLNHLDVTWSWPQSTPSEGHRIGTILGAAVLESYKDLKAISPGLIQVQSQMVELALPAVTPEQVTEARQTAASTKDDSGGNFMKLVRAHRVLDIAAREGKAHQVEVQVIALGTDLAWVGLPGEVFVELGLAIKKRSPFINTFVVELANDSIGYIPDRRSYAEGNYEPESSRCAPGSGEKLVEAACALLADLHSKAKVHTAR